MMPRKLLTLCHCSVAVLVFTEVADMETGLGLAGRCVDPVFLHSRRLAPSGLLKMQLNTLRGSLMRVQATDIF